MNTCGTCKYFGKLDDTVVGDPDRDFEEVTNTRLHICELLKHLNDSSNYHERLAIFRAAHAGVVDGSGYYAALCVSEDFGCNQWVERDAVSRGGSQS